MVGPQMEVEKETYTFLDDDIARFIEEGMERRRGGVPRPDGAGAGPYEKALRVIGRYIDQQKPRDELKQMVDAGAGWRADRPTGAAQPKPPVPPGSG